MYKIKPYKKRMNRLGLSFLLIIILILVLFPDAIAPYDLGTLEAPYLSPDRIHILGTNDIGQDILSELIHGARLSLFVGLVAAMLATTAGTFIGLVSGYFRGVIDDVLMRITDIFLLVPGLPLIILLAAYLGPGLRNIIIIIALLAWPTTARVVRSHVLKVREKAFVMSARSVGGGHFYIMFRHILPNSMEIVLAKATLAVAGAMLTETGVSFLGLGDSTRKSWGTMLHDAFSQGGLVNGYYWWYLPPIFCISLAVLGFTLVGYAFLHSDTAGGLSIATTMNKLRDDSAESDLNDRPSFSGKDLLMIEGLCVEFQNTDGTTLRALNEIELCIKEEEKTALIGETGSGKSVLFLTLLHLLPVNTRIKGRVFYKGEDIFEFSDEKIRRLRGSEIAYIPQGTGNALNPVLSIGFQIAEPTRVHQGLSKKEAWKKATTLLDNLGVEKADERVFEYPHHYSGGMKQRALIAIALATEADLLLADEPTKGLDWKRRNEILHIFKNLDSKTVLAVTHDLWFAEKFAQRVVVLYAGKIVEIAPRESFFTNPLHPYSQALLAALPARGSQVMAGYSPTHGNRTGPGCDFRTCCDKAIGAVACYSESPPLIKHDGHMVRCWLYAF